MKKNILSLLALFLIVCSANAQLNEYKYVVIPKKFEGFKNENQYMTSTLVKHLFTEQGFNAVYDDELPEELAKNACLGLRVGLQDNSNMFTTKAALQLKNCNNQEVFLTQEGRSKEKEYKLGYSEAITKAFKSIEALNYTYEPASEVAATPVKETVVQREINQTQVALPKEAVAVVKKDTPAVQTPKANVIPSTDILYAQQITNGYQLVDSKPSIRLKMYATSVANVFLVEGDKQGIVYQNNGKWFFEYYVDGQLQSETLEIKF